MVCIAVLSLNFNGFLMAAKLTQFPAALATGEGGGCPFDWGISSTIHDLFSTGQVSDKPENQCPKSPFGNCTTKVVPNPKAELSVAWPPSLRATSCTI